MYAFACTHNVDIKYSHSHLNIKGDNAVHDIVQLNIQPASSKDILVIILQHKLS